jgi:two-component system, cell cycle sensor histidine kinase and response regulator CckA
MISNAIVPVVLFSIWGLLLAILVFYYFKRRREDARRKNAPDPADPAFIGSDERFRVLADNIPGVVYLCRNDPDYTLLYVNPKVEELTGYDTSEFESGAISLARIIHPDDLESVQQHVSEMVEAGKSFESTYRIRHKNGYDKWVNEVGVGLFRDGKPVMLEGYITDISERKTIENALIESEEKLRKIIEKSNDAIYVIQGKQFVLVNQKFLDIFKYTIGEITAPGFTFVHLLDEDSIPLIEERRRRRERGDVISDRITFIGKTKDDEKIHLEASITTMEWEQKPAVLGILRDVTIQNQLEEQLRHSQKIEAVGRLAGGLAHDFNNILTAISGYAELVHARLEDETTRANVQEIITASERATKLVQQLLAFSRRQVIKPIPINLNTIISEMDSLLHRVVGDNVQVSIFFEETLGIVEIDPALVEQVIMNLVINARDAMPDGGLLNIETFNIDLSSEYGSTHSEVLPGKYVGLAISDTGVGIDESIRGQIYEPFFTTKEKGKGTGLGLSTVYGIVKQSGGHIWCYSEIDKGTTFKVYLPRVDKEVAADIVREQPPAYEIAASKNETVLLAEDEDGVRGFCRSVLIDHGYTVLEARDGMEALEVAKRHAGNIHLLIADVMMPGLNGKDLADRLTGEDKTLKVIYISGYTNNIVVKQGIVDPGIAFIQKPFSSKILAARVREILDGG